MTGKNHTQGRQWSGLIWFQAARETDSQRSVAAKCDNCLQDGDLTQSCAFDKLLKTNAFYQRTELIRIPVPFGCGRLEVLMELTLWLGLSVTNRGRFSVICQQFSPLIRFLPGCTTSLLWLKCRSCSVLGSGACRLCLWPNWGIYFLVGV